MQPAAGDRITPWYQYRSLEVALWAVAFSCLAVLLFASITMARAQHEAQRIGTMRDSSTAQMNTQAAVSDGKVTQMLPAAARQQAVGAGQVIGRLEIPALKLSVPITSGVETSSLLGGVGHVDGTANPGGLGTIVLAGHRDTYLRPLEHVAKGMDIRITDQSGTFHYSVDRWEIVLPEQVESVSIRATPEVALVTCYPFHFVGAAPRRFIVHAHLVSVTPD